MRILLDKEDVTKRLGTALALNGLVVTDIRWLKDGDEQIAVVTTDDDARPEVSFASRDEVEKLRNEIAELRAQLATVSEARATPPAEPARFRDERQKFRQGKAKASQASTAGLSPRVLKEVTKMQTEEGLIGHPLGTNFQPGERQLGPNESEDFPG